jgi:hypothetical protein
MRTMTEQGLLDSLLDHAVQPQQTLSLGRLGSLVEALARLIGHRESEEVTLTELRALLAQEGLSALPMSAALALLDAVAPVARVPDVLGRLTVRQFELLLDDVPM